MACNCKIILSISILLITLLQLYFQYSSFMTNRNQHLEEKDKRKQLYTLNFVFGRRYEFNLAEIDTFFNENPLMKINALKNFVLNRCEKWNESREKKLNIKIYELFYLMIYDLIFIIFLYFFIFKFYPAGIVKIFMQILKFIFTAIRIKKINPAISIFNVICNHFDNRHLREVEIFDAEGFEIFEFLCNLVIIFDILYLILIIKDKRTPKKPDDNEIIVKKQILTDDNRVDYKDEENIELNEKKIYSNENNNESDEDSDKNNNSNNKDDDNENEIARQTINDPIPFIEEKWNIISDEAKDFVRKCLEKDPKKRINIKEILKHKWLKKYLPEAQKNLDLKLERLSSSEILKILTPNSI